MNEDLYNHIIYQDLKYKNKDTVLISRAGNIYNCSTKNTFIDFFKKYLKNSALQKETCPYLISTGCGRLPQIESIKYSKNIQEHLNNNGLSIYLFEDLYIGTGTKIKNYLKGPSPNDVQYYEKYQYYIKGFESTTENLSSIYSDELESINAFVLSNNLNNVTVYTCDYQSDKYLQEKYQNFKIKTRNLFLISSAKRLNTQTTPDNKKIEYKFWCGNVRYRSYRHLVAAYVNSKSSLITLDQTKSIYGSLQNQLWFDLNTWREKYPNIFQILTDNLVKLLKTPVIHYSKNNNLSNYSDYNFLNEHVYDKTFCSIVTESRFSQPTSIFSEKTLAPILKHRPFVLVAPPYTLEYLKNYGFKTFDNFWDESYDQETNHERRLIKIFEVIEYIDSMSLKDLKNLYQRMIPVLEHNYLKLQELPYNFYE